MPIFCSLFFSNGETIKKTAGFTAPFQQLWSHWRRFFRFCVHPWQCFFCQVLASGLTVTKKICQTKNQFVICISLQSLDVTIRVCGKGFDFGPEPESAKAVALRIMTAKASISAQFQRKVFKFNQPFQITEDDMAAFLYLLDIQLNGLPSGFVLPAGSMQCRHIE